MPAGPSRLRGMAAEEVEAPAEAAVREALPAAEAAVAVPAAVKNNKTPRGKFPRGVNLIFAFAYKKIYRHTEVFAQFPKGGKVGFDFFAFPI